MKIAYGSDLHLEFGGMDVKDQPDADVLILAGDILVAKDLKYTSKDHPLGHRLYKFLQEVNEKYPVVLYVEGNHAHYHGDINTTESIIREALKPYKYIYFMHNEYVTVNDVVFYGGTMWTYVKDQYLKAIAHLIMNDYEVIRDGTINGTKKLTVDRTNLEHKKFLAGLDVNKTDVVISHHHPSSLSILPEYEHYDNNDFFYTDLSELILGAPDGKLRYWIAGHMHNDIDYVLGHTNVLCNPRGYVGIESKPIGYKFKTFNI